MDGSVPESLPKDRPFDPSKIPADSDAEQLVVDVLGRLAAVEKRVRRRRSEDQRRYVAAVTALVCDLAHRDMLQPKAWITVELSNRQLAGRTRRAPFLTEQFRDIVKLMVMPEAGIAEIVLGTYSPFGGRCSTLRAGGWLATRIAMDGFLRPASIGRDPTLLCDPLELRSVKVRKKFKVLPLSDSEAVRQLRAEMQEINAWLAAADVDWDAWPDEDGVDPGDRHMRRVFNDGSLELGGRLIGGFWQKVKGERRLSDIRIEGKRIASIDFAQMSVRLAYAKVGASPPPGDLYAVPGLRGSRDGVKRVLNALLATDGMPRRLPQDTRPCFPRACKFPEILDAISKFHAPIAPLFGSKQAVHFMHLESKILIATLLRLKSRSIVALPIHDCVLVSHDHGAIAQATMGEAFKEITGAEGPTAVKVASIDLGSPTVSLGSTLQVLLG